MFKNINPILLLFLRAIGLYMIWYGVYELYLAEDGRLDRFLNGNIALTSSKFLQLIGYDSSLTDGHVVAINGRDVVSIGSPCNGLVVYALFAGFLVVMPGEVKHKVWYAAVGMLLLYAINVLRVVALSLNQWYSPETFDFNHRYVYQLAVYAVVLLLWQTWVKRFSGLMQKGNESF